ncbi:MAG: hypothetical protein AMXMBFR13_00330 [Phycisphaerae bacterium]
MSATYEPQGRSRTSGPFTRALDWIGSIPFGLAMLILIFVYSSIGSAAPPIRQGAMADWTGLEFLRFDKSEMEWFSWWPFQIMTALFCLAMVIITIRRIRLTLVNAGVWAIHTGIVILAVSSAYYFGTKVEGDAVIFQSLARIRVPGAAEGRMVVRPQAAAQVGEYQVSVSQINPNYSILTGEDQGKRAQQIWFNVTSPRQTFIRTMLVGYPDYTEDVIAGAGGMQRAVKATGEKLVDKDLQIVLDYDPVQYFYHAHQPPVRSTGAVYARFSPEEPWQQLRVSDLPHYHERVTHRDELWPVEGEPLPPIRKLDLPAVKPADAKGLDGIEFRVTDYLPYANLERRWVEGGSMPFPLVRFRIESGARSETHELMAFDPQGRQKKLAEDFHAQFEWADSAEKRETLIRQPEPKIKVRVTSKELEKTFPIKALYRAGEVGLEGTDYKIHLREVFPGGMIAAHSPAMALIRVTQGEQTFERVVLEGDTGGGRDLDKEVKEPVDPDIKFEYIDAAQARMLLVASGSDQVDVVLTRVDGTYQHHQATPGEQFTLVDGVTMTVDGVLDRARPEVRPAIVPPAQRMGLSSVGKTTSLVRVEVADGRQIQSVWLPFNQYAFPDEQRAQPRRFGYSPRTVQLSDGRTLWLLYSRWRDPLPSPVALDRFVLKTYPGGDRPSDYISLIRFLDDGKWSDIVDVKSNDPARHDDLWYFQAQWDPEIEAHTVLGVGNRNGVHAMLLGVVISIAGMVYAFYVKPVVIRRRKQAALAAAARGRGPSDPSDAHGQPDASDMIGVDELSDGNRQAGAHESEPTQPARV